MNADNARSNYTSNYTQDRSSKFKHNVPDEIGLRSAPTVQDYVNFEKAKQMNKMRDWYLESKDAQTDLVTLRSSFVSSRSFSEPTPLEEVDRNKGYLIAGIAIAAIIGGVMLFVHF